MTDQKPTGVFVRLPVTDEQAREMCKVYCAAYASSSLTTRGTATQAALFAIGAPVWDGKYQQPSQQQTQQLELPPPKTKTITITIPEVRNDRPIEA